MTKKEGDCKVKLKKITLIALGLVFVGIGAIGVVMPLVTVGFILALLLHVAFNFRMMLEVKRIRNFPQL